MSSTKATWQSGQEGLAKFKMLTDGAGEPTGEVEFYASKFGNVDLVGDRMVKGSFTASLDEWRKSGNPIPIVFSHAWSDPFGIIGSADPNDVTEDDTGLLVKGRLDIEDNPTAKQVWKNMQRRTLNEASFAYDVVRESGLKKGRDGANDIYEVRLLEVGPTLKGANPETVGVLSAKSSAAPKSKDAPLPGSVEATQAAIIDAVVDAAGSADGDDVYYSVVATYTDHAIVSRSDYSDSSYETTYFSYPYTVAADGSVDLGAATEVQLQTHVTSVAKGDEPDGAKASDDTEDKASGSEDPAVTLFDLSDKAHTTIAVGVVFGAEDERDGKAKPQSEWSYRGTNPGKDLSAAQVATVVSRVRAAAEKFDVSLTKPADVSKSAPDHETKAGSRNSAADQKRVQDIHDAATALGADCAVGEKAADADGVKDSASPGVPIGVVETPDDATDGVDVDLATDEDDEVTVTDAEGNAFTVARSALSQVNTETKPHEDNDPDDDPDADADGVVTDEKSDDAPAADVEGPAAPAPSASKSYELELLELEEFAL